MIKQLLPYLEAGALVLTANQRLARSLVREYDDACRDSGCGAWATPKIVPIGAWLNSLWLDATLAGAVRGRLLSLVQEHYLWERIIRDSGCELLQVRQAARAAAEAAALVRQYRLSLRPGEFQAHPDATAFLAWLRDFERRCDQGGWTPRSQLPDAVAALLADRVVAPPDRAVLCGFDEFTPQQQALLAALADAGCDWIRVSTKTRSADVRCASFPDAETEYRAAAAWARRMVEDERLTRVAIIVPALAGVRAVVERVFTEELDPGSMANLSRPRAPFHVSAGSPLPAVPIVRAALLTLRLARGRLTQAEASALLRTPYLRHSDDDCAARALFDVRLRRPRRRHVTVAQLRPAMPELFASFDAAWRVTPRLQNLAQWASSFERLLEAAGWPGGAALTSTEFQAKQAFSNFLEQFASSDISDEPVDFDAAYDRVTSLAGETEFAIEDEGAPIQVMGVLEAAGSTFDAVWVTGLHDGAWPQPAHANPFLPLSLQRERNLPHCSAARELEFARMVTTRLMSSAPMVVLSWPEMERDTPLRPSPLLADIADGASPEQGRWIDFLAQPSELETLVDATGPALEQPDAAGGTSILKYQASCPFRAFAELRLGARPLDQPEPGIGPMERGNILHKALELFWREIETHERLCATPPEQIVRIVESCVENAFEQRAVDGRLRTIEISRLAVLILEWLDIESARMPFQVAARELEREREIAGVRFRGRIDRVDRLADGSEIIIDYKANAPSPKGWEGDRPSEPQLPFYAVTHDPPVAGVLFGNLKPGNLKFAGTADRDGLVPDVKPDENLAARFLEWRATLEKLARDYSAGRAEVDPIKGACDYCRLTPLCRASECEAEGGENAETRS